ncbi:hypothetical protein RHMOL_Rhmol10G0039300 [Rhododendron molle]|uniref:Uncharacterized protein n=1 Tax=Rhododendron molle TaxID=49168 RepID=A0ACC0LYU2_RHOML|nr:hypothetical protein RHMOL_Rhmol10G0039300 [Rhododendron molle]
MVKVSSNMSKDGPEIGLGHKRSLGRIQSPLEQTEALRKVWPEHESLAEQSEIRGVTLLGTTGLTEQTSLRVAVSRPQTIKRVGPFHS